MKFTTRTTTIVSTLAASALLLAGCSNSQTDSDMKVDTATGVETTAAETADSAVTFTNAYVRAMEEGVMMTAIFGDLTNTTDSDITVESFTASIDASSFELHEVVDGQMRMKEGGFTIQAGETLTLQPGHEHMMVMGVKTPVMAGETVDLTITLADGTSIDVPSVPVRTVGAGDENYGDLEHEGMDHEGMNHEGMDHEGMDHSDMPATTAAES